MVLNLLKTISGVFHSELELQDRIEVELKTAGYQYSREHILTKKDRPDFFIDGLVIEVKVDGSSSSVTSQVWRYAQHESVKSIFVVTTKRKHRLPNSMDGKPVSVIYVCGLY